MIQHGRHIDKSYNPEYLFIHINKCAGTSIKKALGWKRSAYQRYKHEPISDIAQRMDKQVFKDIFTFAFIRNPYDRIPSMYFYRKYNLGRVKLKQMGFQEWFWKAFTEDFTAVPLMNEPCWTYLSIDNALAVDFVGKVEHMNRDWKRLCNIMGINAKLPAINLSKQKEEVTFTEEMKQLVEDRFSKDLEFYR